jgi:uncharacterized protein YjbJ (UPF0337 family)
MQRTNDQSRWQQVRGKKHTHRGILTLDDLPKTNGNYRQLIAQLQARYQAAKEQGKDVPNQKSEDFSIEKEIPYARRDNV